MSDALANHARGRSRSLRVGLVAAERTIRRLGPVMRHLVIGLLGEPMPMTLICPAGCELTDIPAFALDVIEHPSMGLPLLRGRILTSLARQVHSAGVGLLHALDEAALGLTRQLAVRADVDYVAGAYALDREIRAGDHRCRALLAGSAPIQRMLVESHAGAAEIIRLLRPGVHQVRSATCFIDPQHSTAIVASGDLGSFEPFAAVLDSFVQLKQAGRECVYFLIGNGRAEARLRRRAEKLDLMEELTFVDRQEPEQLGGILKAADIFISPRPTRRLDVELLTAMAAGVPVVTADAPAADFVLNEQTALAFKAGDATELTVRLLSLIDDRAAARNLADAALEHLRVNHSPSRMTEELLAIYREVARGPVTSV